MKLDRSTLDYDLREESKMRHDNPRMLCITSIDHICVRILDTTRRTLHQNVLKSAPPWLYHRSKTR
jgi:hypothetical protein